MAEKVYKNADSKVIIKVLKDKCISAATCVVLAPDTFDLDKEGIVYVKETSWDEAQNIINAAKSCPTQAIIIEDLQGNQLFPEKTK